jgi:hypothetical protein
LRADHPQTLHGVALLEEGPEHYAAWKHLCAILRDGQQDGFVREFGQPLFARAMEEPEYGAVFNMAMSSYANGLTPMVLEALAPYDFSTVAHVCDVGGGYGVSDHRGMRWYLTTGQSRRDRGLVPETGW